MNVYLDYASTTPIHPEVIDYMSEIMRDYYGNPSSIHRLGREARTVVEKSRRTIAQVLNCSIGEIFFTSSATEAHNTLLKRSVQDLDIERIIFLPLEHHCGIHCIEEIEKIHTLETIPLKVDKKGNISIQDLEGMLNDNKKTLVSVMHVNNEIGNIYPIDKIGEICAQAGALFHTDTVQSIGKIPLDFTTLHADLAAGSAHKFYGPKGVGFMYINDEVQIKPMIYGGAQERNMRAGTENIIGIAGMAKALEIADRDLKERAETIALRQSYFEEKVLQEIQGTWINGSETRASHITSVSFPSSPHVDMLMFNLDIGGIAASSASACSSGIEADSHVLKAIQHPDDRKSIRFSFSHLTSEDELDYVISILKKHTQSA